ncbi:acyl-CoA dehydrogenase family protein [Halalkalibacter akibai]|uniref:Acyl-CoA dehydrogenase n=1 Tax=Halalkalibacter akibai (strain ATCC 43226 / DSM 21942 / CIP 109018 / JCM 9157 / 1139) TaxID=1236973 RepID=W4QPU0_HALA3|nr:acyl-CoA dehydrogenase family protein [Halalkalibacter akibai]GAE33364.1 acyl-CoA dehydrogenase [Halalkalibacter akibai JCM 9157]
MNTFTNDLNLQYLLKRYLKNNLHHYAVRKLPEFADMCSQIDERAKVTDRDGQPKLIKYDKYGEDISEVWVNEGYKQTVKDTYNTGIVGFIHKEIPELKQKGNYPFSFAQGYLLSQVEPGFYCPVTLTMATAYLVDTYANDELKAQFLPHILSTGETELYEGATFLTERQGGSDVGANEVKAVKIDGQYHLYGEKYFASNAGMCGVVAVLARLEDAPSGTKGLSLFLMPWKKSDGTNNHLQIRRLKDKLGVRAVPSAEVVLEGSEAYLIGEADQGFYYMMEALNLSRVCNAIASVGIMRRAYNEACNYTQHREAFGKKLSDYPMIRETLMTLKARQEVETSACFHTIDLFDRVITNPSNISVTEKALNRLYIALVKMRTAEEAITFSHEAIELHGGNGYIEDFVTPRLLRDAQVLTVWEGTENILGLEVLRLMEKFQVDQLFINEMLIKLNQISTEFKELVKPVKLAVTQLTELCQKVRSGSNQLQTYHAKKVANLMTDIYLSVIALEDALLERGRKIAIAEIFLEELWSDKTFNDNPATLKYYDYLLGFEIGTETVSQ